MPVWQSVTEMQSTFEVTAISLGLGVGCTWSFLPEAACSARPGYEGGEGAAPLPTCPSPPARACPSTHHAHLESQLGAVARLPAHSTCLMKALRLWLPAGPGDMERSQTERCGLCSHPAMLGQCPWQFSREQTYLFIEPGCSEVCSSASSSSVEGGGKTTSASLN